MNTPSSALAPGRALRVVILGPQAHAGPLRRGPQVPRAGLVERQALRDGGEELVDVLGRLGRRLEEEQAGLGGVLLGVVGGYGALGGVVGDEVELVAGERDDDVFVGLALELLDPGLGLVERGLRHVSGGCEAEGGGRTACVMS
jgi:hypothetical protein